MFEINSRNNLVWFLYKILNCISGSPKLIFTMETLIHLFVTCVHVSVIKFFLKAAINLCYTVTTKYITFIQLSETEFSNPITFIIYVTNS